MKEDGTKDDEKKVDPEFLKYFYQHQYEQRWRGSRNQDWIIVSTVATMMGAIIFLNAKLLESVGLIVLTGMLFLPIILFVFAEVGIRILIMHQQVMDHANHIAKGVEAHFRVIEKGNTAHNLADKLYVGLTTSDEGVENFTYPNKKTYKKYKPISYEKFISDSLSLSLENKNVQSAIGGLYHMFQAVAIIILIVDLLFILEMFFPGVVLPILKSQ